MWRAVILALACAAIRAAQARGLSQATCDAQTFAPLKPVRGVRWGSLAPLGRERVRIQRDTTDPAEQVRV